MDELNNAFASLRRAQLEARIQELNRLITQYRNEINYYTDQITNIDRSYESLSSFKAAVQQSQECFSAASTGKSSVLEQVKAVSRNNTAAAKYYDGMKHVLTGTGAKIASKVYSLLLTKIGSEQGSLRTQSDNYSNTISYYNRLLANAQSELAQKKQELQNI